MDNLYVQIIFSSLTEINHLRTKSKNAEGKELKTEIEEFIKGVSGYLNNKKNLIDLKEEFEIIKNKLVNDSSIYAHVREITKKMVDIVQEHDEIKKDYDSAYIIETQISKKYFNISIVLMVLGLVIALVAIYNCYSGGELLITINGIITLLVILLGYMLFIIIYDTIKDKKELDKFHKKIHDIEQESLDISSIND